MLTKIYSQNKKEKCPIIYLIGINHKIQIQNISLEGEFRKFLTKTVKKYKPDLIAEEFSEEALKINNVNCTIAQEVSKQNAIRHLLCDPDTETRKQIGYPSRNDVKLKLDIKKRVLENSPEDKLINDEVKKYYYIREKFWLKKILSSSSKIGLFICGVDHLKAFQKLLSKNGFIAIILPTFCDL